MTRTWRVAPFSALVLAGCLASKGDVQLVQTSLQTSLQAEMRAIRDAAAQSEAAQRTHIDQVLAQIARTNDSVRAVSLRLERLQSDVKTDHYEMNRQILQLQELSGQSQQRIRELRASLEERAQAQAATTPGDSARGAGPGPGQLFQSSYDQLRRGSSSVARSGFEELLRTYPNTPDAPDAMIWIAETYTMERNQAAADSVYGLVIQRYPTSPKAATALYKRALSMRAAGQTTAARAAFNRIIKDYPNTDEAHLANDQLRTLGK